jgi:hypothetical protein
MDRQGQQQLGCGKGDMQEEADAVAARRGAQLGGSGMK